MNVVKRNICFINNSNINSRYHWNQGGIHLNKSETNRLIQNFNKSRTRLILQDYRKQTNKCTKVLRNAKQR